MLNGTTESSRAHIRRTFASLLVVLLITSSAVGALAAVQRLSRAAEIDRELEAQLQQASETDRLLVFVHAPDISTASRAVRSSGLSQVDAFERVGVAVGLGTPDQIRKVREESGVTFVEGDQPIEFFMQTSHIATRGEDALRGFTVTSTSSKKNKKRPLPKDQVVQTSAGVDGSGVSVAIIDSGVDGTHPLFQDAEGNSKVLKNYKFVCVSGVLIPLAGPCNGAQGDAIDPAFVDMTFFNDTDTPSTGGHGTHVAGIAAGVESEDLPVHGAAPGAKIISLSVGQVISVYGGSAGMNWVLEHHEAPCGEGVTAEDCPPIKVINNSWGSGGAFNPDDLRSKLQNALVAEGVAVVWAAGNAGGDGSADQVNPPAKSPTPGILSVANYDDSGSGTRDGGLNTTSSRGLSGDKKTYPDISAPGTSIYSACRFYLAICSSGEEDSDYGTIGGTSMATPHIAGIVAQLIQAGRESLGRDLTPGELEDILEDTAYKFTFGGAYEADLPERNDDHLTSFDKGHGLVDAMAAVAEIRGISLASGETVCGEGGATVSDVTGDGSHSSTDVLEGMITSEDVEGTDGTEVKLTFVTQVDQLTPNEYPEGSNGIFFDFNFTYEGVPFFAGARRRLLGGTPPRQNEETFFIGQSQGSTLATLASGLTGKFDFETHQVVVVVTQADLDRAEAALDVDLPPLYGGAKLTSLVANSRTLIATTGPSLVSADDSAASSCIFQIDSVVAPPAPGPPQEPNGTISLESPEYTWKGEPTTDSEFVFGCDGPSGSTCDEEFIEIFVPEGGATLTVSIDTDLSDLQDFDLYLFGPDGKAIDSSAHEGSAEEIEVLVATPGVYRVVVEAFATVQASYTGTAKLSAAESGA